MDSFQVEDVLSRFSPYLLSTSPDALSTVADREAAALVQASGLEGLDAWLLDLSSESPTGTFKDWVAALTVAHCLSNGIERFVSQSSGNTANALAYYAERAGIQCLVLYPARSRYKIHEASRARHGVTLVEIDAPEPLIKAITTQLAERAEAPWLPDLALQIEGNRLRAFVLHEAMGLSTDYFAWHVQALSSGYGILGYYDVAMDLAGRNRLGCSRLLGVQQEAVSPYVDAHYCIDPAPTGTALAEPTLFRSQPPPSLIDRISRIVDESGGMLLRLSNSALAERLEQAVGVLDLAGLAPQRVELPDGSSVFREMAPVIAVAGVLEALAAGDVGVSERLLVTVTGGSRPIPGGISPPGVRLTGVESAEEAVSEILLSCGW